MIKISETTEYFKLGKNSRLGWGLGQSDHIGKPNDSIIHDHIKQIPLYLTFFKYLQLET
jgi:hypothetical protein